MRWLIVLLVACSTPAAPKTSTTAAQLSLSTTCNVLDFGATPNDDTDDRAAIQAAIDACSASGTYDVYVPSGTFIVGRTSISNWWGISIPSGTRLRGANRTGTILKQPPGVQNSTRIIRVMGEDVTVENLTLDGNKLLQSVNEQRHGLVITESERTTIRDVAARNFTGDGFYLLHSTLDTTFERVFALNNDRNGLTLGGSNTNTTIHSSYFLGNAAQQVDSEPGPPNVVSGVKLIGSTLDSRGRNPNGYVLTISGVDANNPFGRDWTVVGNTLAGAIFVVVAERVLVADNLQVNPGTKPCITVRDGSRNVVYRGNRCLMTVAPAAPPLAAVYVLGTTAVNSPSRVVIEGNTIDVSAGGGESHGVAVTGALSAEIRGNLLHGPGKPSPTLAHGGSGIYVRATIADLDMRSVLVAGNRIEAFGAYGISTWGSGTAKLLALVADGNVFDDALGTMATAIRIDGDGLGATKSARAVGNTRLGGVATLLIAPTGLTVVQ